MLSRLKGYKNSISIWLFFDKVLYLSDSFIWILYSRQPTIENNDNLSKYKSLNYYNGKGLSLRVNKHIS